MATTILYHGDAYELAQATSPLIADVEALGFRMRQAQIACYDMTFCIVDNQLVLRDILMLKANSVAVGTNIYNGEIHRELAYHIPYTGKLLIVRDLFQHNLLSDHHNPFMSIEAYDTIRELVFKEGELICSHDHSATMSALRTVARKWRKPDNQFDFLANLSAWMQAIYGEEYDLWWLPVAA